MAHRPQNGGYLVKHLEPDPEFKTDPILQAMSDGQTFGWCYHEVEPIQ